MDKTENVNRCMNTLKSVVIIVSTYFHIHFFFIIKAATYINVGWITITVDTCLFNVTSHQHNYGHIDNIQIIISGGRLQTYIWVEPPAHHRLAGKPPRHMKVLTQSGTRTDAVRGCGVSSPWLKPLGHSHHLPTPVDTIFQYCVLLVYS